jgi:hypothetical protein
MDEKRVHLRVKVAEGTPSRLEKMALQLGYERPAGHGVTIGAIGEMLDDMSTGKLVAGVK